MKLTDLGFPGFPLLIPHYRISPKATDSNMSITSIGLDCLKTINDELCENKYLDDAQSIKIFEEVINNATKMEGILNYAGKRDIGEVESGATHPAG